MTHDELREEVRAIVDLNQRLSERIETFTRRLHRHFAEAGGEKAYYQMTSGGVVRPIRTRDDEDDGDD